MKSDAAAHAGSERAFDGNYQLGSEIATGTHGVVYRGVDEKLAKEVAIKVWHARFKEDAPERTQYDAEARALTALEHPNLVAVTDYGVAAEAPYLVMELLEGETLEEHMRDGGLDEMRVEQIMQSVLRGLGYMHVRGQFHRNVKPDNIVLAHGPDGSELIKLLDLGIESVEAPSARTPPPLPSRRSAYDAPERATGAEPDGRSDVFSAAVLLLHMLSGKEPSLGVVRALASAQDTADGEPLPGFNPSVRSFLARALATERQERFGNADQMLRAMLELTSPWLSDNPDYVAEAVPPVVAHSSPAPAKLSAAPDAQPDDDALTAEDPYRVDESDVALQPTGTPPPEANDNGLETGAEGDADPFAEAGPADADADAPSSAQEQSDAGAQDDDLQAGFEESAHPAAVSDGALDDAALAESEHADEHETSESAHATQDEAPAQGLRAKLAARKLQLAIGGATLALALAGGVWAMRNRQNVGAAGSTEHQAEQANLVKPAAPKQPDGHAAAAKHAQGEPDDEEDEEGEEEEDVEEVVKLPAAAAAGPTEPAAPAAPETPAIAAADQPMQPPEHQPGSPPAEAPSAAPSGEDAKRGAEQGAAALAPKGSEVVAAHGGDAVDVSRSEQAGAATSAKAAHAAQAHEPGPAAHDAAAKPEPTAVQPSQPSEPTTNAHAPAGTAPDSDSEAAKDADEPAAPGKPTRRVRPSQSEIRHLLALALTPKPRAPAKNPWSVALPKQLEEMRAAIQKGERATNGHIRALRRFNAQNANDPYGHLLLAAIYANRGWALDALDQYDLAYQIEPSARGAPEMLAHALKLVGDGVGEGDAERFIEKAYGREAQSAIAGALRERGGSAAAVKRLKALQGRIVAGKRVK